MATDSRKRAELVIGLVGVLAACLFLVWTLKSGRPLPFGLHNPFAKAAPVWADATPDEKTAAQAVIQQQLDALERKDYQAVINMLSAQADPALRNLTHISMIDFRMFPRGARTPVFGAITADPKTRQLLVVVTINGTNGAPKIFEYRLVKEQGTYQILSFHYPDNAVPENQRSG